MSFILFVTTDVLLSIGTGKGSASVSNTLFELTDVFASIGIIESSPAVSFILCPLADVFGSANAERIKATLRTNKGSQAYNFSGDGVDRLSLKDIKDSRIEIIAKSGFPGQTFEEGLLHAVCV